MPSPTVPPWWLLKVLTGAALVAYVAVAWLWGTPVARWFAPLVLPAQALVVAGGAVHLAHYALLKRAAKRLDAPGALVTRGLLYARVRHPMYLGDLIVLIGLTLLQPDVVAASMAVLGALAIARQCVIEDAQMAARFGGPFHAWKAATRRLVPFVW